MKAGEIFVEIRAEFAKFASQLSQVKATAQAAGDAIENALGGGAKKAEAQVGKSTSAMQKHLQEVGRIASGIIISQAFYASVNAIQTAGRALLDFRIEMENASIAFETLLGSAAASEKFMDAAKDFAAESPFELVDIEQGAKRLLAFRFQAESVLPVLRILGDTAAGLGGGADTLDGIIRAIGQIKTKGKVQAEELMQLAERGIPAYDILREKLGLTQEQISKIGDQNISAAKAIPALLEGMEEQFGGLSDKLADSTGGLLSNIKDSLKIIGVDVFDSLFDNFQGTLQGMAKTLDKWRETLNAKGVGGLFEEIVPDHLQNSIRMIIASIQLMWENTKRFAQAISPFLAGVRDALVIAFSVALPIMAVFGRVLSELAAWATQNEEAIRFLVAAILLLAIASKVAALVQALVIAVRGLAIAARAGVIVSALATAIRTLSIALFMNPIGLAVVAISVGLIALISMSDKATGALDRLLERFYAFMGLDFEGVMNPAAKPKTDGINEYMEGLEDIGGAIGDLEDDLGGLDGGLDGVGDGAGGAGDGVDKVGDKAKEAGKKAKGAAKEFKKFVASFDEVYSVPEPDSSGGSDGGGKDPGGGKPGGGKPGGGGPGGGPGGGGGSGGDNPFGALPRLPDEIMLPKFVWPPFPPFPAFPPFPPLPNFEWPGWPAFPPLPALPKFEMPKLPVFDWPAIPIPDLSPVSKRFGEFGRTVGDVLGKIPDGVTAMLPRLRQAWETGFAGLPAPVQNVVNNVKTFFQDIPNGVTAIIPGIRQAWEGAMSQLPQGVQTAIATLPTLFGSIPSILEGMKPSIQGAAGSVAKGIGDVWNKFFGENHPLNKPFDEFVLDTLALAAPAGPIAKAVGKIPGLFKGLPGAIGQATAKISPDFGTLMSKLNPTSIRSIGDITKSFGGLGGKISSAISNVPSTVSGWMSKTPKFATDAIENMRKGFSGLGGKVSTAISDVPGKVSSWMSKTPQYATNAIESMRKGFGGLGGKVSTAISDLPTKVSTWMQKLPSKGQGAVDAIVRAFSNLGGRIKSAISDIPGKVRDILGDIKLPSFSTVKNGVTASFRKLESIAGFETGGIIGKDSIVRVGERGKREAIIPLQNGSAMAPFADAVAQRLGMFTNNQSRSTDERPILYVGNLIADDRSLRELERRMQVIRLNEGKRGV